MKKILLLLTVFSMVFASCDPLEDIYEEVDTDTSAVVGDVVYTLTDEDYEELELSYGSFSSEDDAKTTLPGFLANKYPVWGKGSSALIDYKLYVGSAEGISDYTYSEEYSLALSNYPSFTTDNAVAFYESENADDYLPAILEANFVTAEEGDVVLAKYSQYVGETINGITEFYSADFAGAGTLLDYEAVSVVGDQVWEGTNYGAKISGYDGGSVPNEDWLISPSIDLSSFPNATLEVNQIYNYADYTASVLISTDYTDDIAAATWDVIELTNIPDGTSWDEYLSDPYSLSAYNGETINIAFKYVSTDAEAGTFEIVDVSLKASGVEGETEDVAEFYTFDGSEWELSEGVYYLSDADFDSMGEGDDQPGEYNNFASSISPDDYLPTFLGIKYPYAQEGDVLDVIYKYYSSSSGAQLRGNLYTFTSGVWTGYESTITTSLQLAHDGSTWVPDNTIKYELVAADYDLIASTYKDVAGYADAVQNLEAYGNISTFNWTDEQIDAAMNTVIVSNYPGMEEGQKFAITVYVYDGSSHNITINYIKEGDVYIRNI